MAPKGKKDGKAQAPAKEEGEGKKNAVKEEPEQGPSKRAKAANHAGALPAVLVSRMLMHLKYHANEKGSADARQGLELWAKADFASRQKLLQAFLECETKEKRNAFKWLHCLERRVDRTDTVSSTLNRGMRYGGEILGFAGLSFDLFKGDTEKATQTIRRLVEKNREDYPEEEWLPEEAAEGEPALSRWYYIRSSGEDATTATATRTSVHSRAQVGLEAAASSALALMTGQAAEEGKGEKGAPATEEAAHFVSSAKHLLSVVEALRREVLRAEGVSCKLAARAKQDEALSKKAGDFSATLSGERAWLQASAIQCEEWLSRPAQGAQIGADQQVLDQLQETASHKLDALRLAMRSVSKFL